MSTKKTGLGAPRRSAHADRPRQHLDDGERRSVGSAVFIPPLSELRCSSFNNQRIERPHLARSSRTTSRHAHRCRRHATSALIVIGACRSAGARSHLK